MILDGVPYVSQIEHGWLAINDCGPASSLMLARAYGRARDTSIDDIYRRYGFPDTGLLVSTIASLLRDLGVPNRRVLGSMTALRDWLAAGYPAILLVDANVLKRAGYTRQDISGGHFVVAVGFEGEAVVIHDPYQTNGRGRNVYVPAAVLDRAWGPHGQYAYVAILPDRPLLQGEDMADIQTIKAALAAMQVEIDRANAALGDSQGGPSTVTVRRQVNFRSQPNTRSTVYRLMPAGEQLVKLGEVSGEVWNGSALWYRLRDKSGVEGYAHASFF